MNYRHLAWGAHMILTTVIFEKMIDYRQSAHFFEQAYKVEKQKGALLEKVVTRCIDEMREENVDTFEELVEYIRDTAKFFDVAQDAI